VDPRGAPGDSRVVGTTDAGRPSGFPRLATLGGRAYVVWTKPGPPPELRLAAVELGASAARR
ncbi:MAG TPA: hypothetical protein VJS92_05940, partial [Candidatus Polarisedimenticolaceae bacterium]|nr:hypothetical protein [Candidatus Polarisedimenticolaceae bacterium]